MNQLIVGIFISSGILMVENGVILGVDCYAVCSGSDGVVQV